MALPIKQIQAFYLSVLRIAGFLEYLQQMLQELDTNYQAELRLKKLGLSLLLAMMIR